MFIPRRFWSHTYISKQIFTYSYATTSDNPKLHEHTCWNSSIAEAEKVIGYPTSFLNLRWLLNDEVANIALHLRKLLGTNHPLLSVAKDLILNDEKPSWGLIVLLVSKAGGQTDNFSLVDKDVTTGVLHSQRIVAEVAEMLRTSNLIHKHIKNSTSDKNLDANMGNKLALLSGDYLLSKSYNELASLRNSDLHKLISSGLRDMTEGEFVGPRDIQNKPLPAPPKCKKYVKPFKEKFNTLPLDVQESLGHAKFEWTNRNMLSGISLLAKSCQGALLISGHSEYMQHTAYLVGKYLGLSLQARREVISVREEYETNLVSAPFIFHLEDNSHFYKYITNIIDKNDNLDMKELCQIVKSGKGLEKTEELIKEYINIALQTLMKFHKSTARSALSSILQNILDSK